MGEPVPLAANPVIPLGDAPVQLKVVPPRLEVIVIAAVGVPLHTI
jgi:hypothetical protein